MSIKDWTSRAIAITDLDLDLQNPRLEMKPGSTQPDVAESLLKHEEIVDLAQRIASFGGFYPNERIIAAYENSCFVVLEGNRRVCAAKLLINPAQAPAEYEPVFLGLTTKTLKEALQIVDVEVAPSRQAAGPLIAHIHAFAARKQWSPLSKMRFSNQLVDEHGSFEKAGLVLTEPASEVRRLVRRYRIYKHALSLGGWSPDEIERLVDDRLKPTAYLRFFEQSEPQQLIGPVFDRDGHFISNIDKRVMKRHLRTIARDFLLPAEGGRAPPESTRTDVGPYLKEKHKELIDRHARIQSPPIPPAPIPPAPRPSTSPTPLPAVNFFQDLDVHVEGDHRLYNLCREIKLIAHTRTPIAAFLLLRSLLKASLEYHLRRVAKFEDFESKKGASSRANLSSLLDYCSRKHHEVFKSDSIRDSITRLSTIKQHMDSVVHNKYADITASALEAIKPYLRPIIEYITSDEEGYA